MRTLILLVLTVVVVSGLTKIQTGRFLLKVIVSEVELIQKQSSEMNPNQYVKDVVPNVGCSAKHLCQAAIVMKNIKHLNNTKLHRQLSAYANNSGQHNCNVPASQHDIKINHFLTNIKKCCKAQYSEA